MAVCRLPTALSGNIVAPTHRKICLRTGQGGSEQHKSFFAPSEAADIKSVMQEYGETTEQHNLFGAWLCDYAESRQPSDEIKHRHTLNEVGDVVDGRYDWTIQNMQQGLQR